MASPASLLVVDDEEPIRRLLKTILVGAGYKVTTAADAEEALALCRRLECFDVVLSDVQMPGMDGHELAGHLASLCPRSRVILTSGSDPGCETCPYVKRCEQIRKPFTFEHVLGVIAEALASPPLERKTQ